MQIYRYSPALIATALAVGALAIFPSWAQARPFHYLNHLRGEVRVGQFMINPDPASEGMMVASSHRLRLGGNGQVTLNCSNGTRHPLNRPGTYAVKDYCPGEGALAAGPTNLPRDPFNQGLPYLLSPRNTALMAPENLLLTWNPVPGATSYQVQLEGRGVNWAVEVSEPQVTFPDTASLQPNYRYAVVITADNGLASGNGPPVGFTVLPAAEVARVKEAVKQIQAQGLEPDIQAIALAMLYLDYGHSDPDFRSYALNHAALQVLATRVQAGSQHPILYLLQAEAYLASGLPLSARASYQQALALGQGLQQREIQAKSQVGLGEIAAGQTDYPGAIAHLQLAQTLYKELGDLEQVEALQTRIATLEKERP